MPFIDEQELTSEEKLVLLSIAQLYETMTEYLVPLEDQDKESIKMRVFELERIVMVRVARRLHPEIFVVPKTDATDKGK